MVRPNKTLEKQWILIQRTCGSIGSIHAQLLFVPARSQHFPRLRRRRCCPRRAIAARSSPPPRQYISDTEAMERFCAPSSLPTSERIIETTQVLEYVAIGIYTPVSDKLKEMSNPCVQPSNKPKNYVQAIGDNVEQCRGWMAAVAAVVAAAAYQAGLSPPGGFWSEDDSASGKVAGTPILFTKFPRRYYLFTIGNAVAFASSLYVFFWLLHKCPGKNRAVTIIGVIVMLVGMTGLAVAYVFGSSINCPPLTGALPGILLGFFIIYVVSIFICLGGSEGDTNGGNHIPSGSNNDNK
ncbi:hypothetical protein ACP70R_001726 [Stipagrostis hirtigluma subsp. patula]